MAKLTNQWNESNYKDLDRQRIYLKDIDCPDVWHEKLKEQIPPCVFYLNESTGEFGGPGSVYESYLTGPGTRKGLGVARAGDLMSCLQPAMRADNLMCYIGHEGTYTPAHREMCASLGQNIMVEASGTVDEDGKATKPGSSIWFMTETKDRHLVSEYWLSILGHDIEIEAHFAQINAWKAAPFKTYVVEQKVGDFILIPPLAPHQVWNRGTRTMKVAWNRTTVETLEMALNEALPRARMVCRDEQYKNKAMILFALEKYSNLLKQVDAQRQGAISEQAQIDLTYNPKIRQLQKDFRRLFALFTQILLSEMLAPVSPNEKKGQYIPFDGYVTCSYCRCNIFNRFMTCTSCVIPLENGEEDTYDICMECYAMGRSCKCISGYKWVEQFPWQELIQKHDSWRHQIIAFEGKVTDRSPKPLALQRKLMTKKTLAQVCQEQLKIRPWADPSKEENLPEEEEEEQESNEVQVNADGVIPRKRKRRRQLSQKVVRETAICHIAQQRQPRWKVAVCGCGRGYAYGTLFRAFDLMPLTVMEDPGWKCPYCLKICSCGTCRKSSNMQPFEPKGTILGHDTRKVADARSVESLVDFSHSNIGWIKKAGDDHPHENRRLRRCRDEAAQDKSTDPNLDDHYVNVEEYTPVATQNPDNGITYNMDIDYPIDPLLRSEQPPTVTPAKSNTANIDNSDLSQDSSQIAKRLKLAVDSLPFQSGHFQADSEVGHSAVGNTEQRQFIAPLALMTNDNSQSRTNKARDRGTFFQYPDPSLADLALSPRAEHPDPPANAHVAADPKNDQRRRQLAALTVLHNDGLPSSGNDANAQYKRARMERVLAEAKRKDRFISTQAAMTGKSLRLRFSIDKSRLAAITGINSSAPEAASNVEANGVEGSEDLTIVQSDLPVAPSPQGQAKRVVPLPKKKRENKEDDGDFSTNKRKDRKAATERASLPPNMTRRSTINYEEPSSGSDGDTIAKRGPNPVDKQQPRALPAYLARRSEGVLPVASLDPHEALTKHRQLKKMSQAHQKSDEAPARKAEIPNPEKQRGPTRTPLNPSNGVVHEPAKTNKLDSAMQRAEEKRKAQLRGPTKTKSLDPAMQRAEENRRAKLRAMRWAEDEDDDLS